MTLVDDVATLVQQRSGLQLDAVMRTRLQRVLLNQRRPGESDSALLRRLGHDPVARQHLYDELTVQETSFFRDPGQFRGLEEVVLPSLPDPVVLWSAGCSNGQEAWSLAMVLAEQGRRGTVVATDLSERALARTREGRYAERELRGLSPERRSRWLVPDGDAFLIAPSLRDRVVVSRHNLATEAAPVTSCAVVFCRNVLIYFARADVVAAVRRFRRVLPPQGWLFLGFSETLWDLAQEFTPVRLGEQDRLAYAYRPAGAPAAGPLAPSASRSAPPAAPPRRLPTVPVAGDLSRPLPELPRSVPVAGRPPVPPEVAVLLAQGERALQAGLAADAVTAFRGAAYLAPDLPITHVELGLALHGLGERTAARRALQTARRVLAAGGTPVEGWDAAALDRFIGERLAALDEVER